MKSVRTRLCAAGATALLACTLSSAFAVPAWASDFIDVPADHWAETSGVIDDAVDLGIIKGSTNPDGTVSFRPDYSVTRAEVATMLMRISGANESSYAATNQTGWVDVPDGAWYTRVMNWAKQSGILNGTNGYARPEAAISRQELAVMLSNFEIAFGSGSIDTAASVLNGYADAGQIASWATKAVAWAVDSDIMGGSSLLNPCGSATRAEAAKMVLVQCENMAAEPDSDAPSGGIEVSGDTVGTAAVELALTFEGADYAYGGSSPEEGFDCSGLVMYVYGQLGISLPHTASGQMAYLKEHGRFVTDPDDLQYGDLVFFDGHVGFYVGDGMLFGARRPGVPASTCPMYAFGDMLGGGQL